MHYYPDSPSSAQISCAEKQKQKQQLNRVCVKLSPLSGFISSLAIIADTVSHCANNQGKCREGQWTIGMNHPPEKRKIRVASRTISTSRVVVAS